MNLQRAVSFRIHFLLIALLCVNTTAAGVPNTVNFQATLSDLDGNPISGEKSIVFSFYNTQDGLTPVWQETQSVQVVDGLYVVQLGSVTPFQEGLFAEAELWLGVKVGDEVLREFTNPNRPTPQLDPGWNLTATSWTPPEGVMLGAQLDNAVRGDVWRFDAGHIIALDKNTDVLTPAIGYWLFCAQRSVFDFPGDEVGSGSVVLHNGWNLVAAIEGGDIPAEITQPVWHWEGGIFRTTTTLEPLMGYWVFSPEPSDVSVELP